MAVELDQIVRLDDDACSPLDALGRNVSLASIKNISDLYPLPSQLKMLFVPSNSLTSNDELQSLPRSITKLSIQGNRYKSFANLNWTNMTLVYLNGCYMLQSMDMVRFSSAIENVDVSELTITRWIMDNSTFMALNSLRPYTTTAADDGYRHYMGYGATATTIKTSGADCGPRNGMIQELWPDKALRSSSSSAFTVCVVKDAIDVPSTSAPAPSTSAPAISTTTQPPMLTSPTSPSNTGMVVGVVVGVAAVLGFACFWYMRRRHRDSRPKQPNVDDVPSSMPPHPTTPQAQYTPFKTPSVRRPSDNTCDSIDLRALASIRLNERDVHLHDIMGTGAFANVWAGSFRGDAVAVKALLSTCVTPHHVESFVAEIQLMASFHSPYIVRVVGACWTAPSDLKCVMEFMDGGDLKHYLDTHTAAAFPWVQKYRHMHSIAEGLAYLHARNVIHRDIKSRNVVVDSTHGTKLTDFGTSKEDILATMTMGVGTFRWMAPEVLQDAGYTISADIYSFGMVLSELDTHHAPYVDHVNPANGHPVADGAVILKVINGSIKPTFTPECPRWVFDLAMRCLDLDPTNRPTAMQISFEIGKFLHDL
ncbi:TKL protein kinase, variant [Aphanomyces invadans]|uniref:TKL protein kinase, variant n=1 Tax=Aphanomyces invadans TaxID=157072 RepID=A0A024TL05_9STRA|nr:TKL protein kinase, variant [Aphanomyces invadans]ETV94820.1 TKL protein kinase, variant [Aphanomyces invadans]|eukprot:XP_008876411.1 TKL protein kinase, variant [Aphanomyces invadans]